jgi:hypothetical protein
MSKTKMELIEIRQELNRGLRPRTLPRVSPGRTVIGCRSASPQQGQGSLLHLFGACHEVDPAHCCPSSGPGLGFRGYKTGCQGSHGIGHARTALFRRRQRGQHQRWRRRRPHGIGQRHGQPAKSGPDCHRHRREGLRNLIEPKCEQGHDQGHECGYLTHMGGWPQPIAATGP